MNTCSEKGYKNDSISPCIFIERFGLGFVIYIMYDTDLNIIRTLAKILHIIICL